MRSRNDEWKTQLQELQLRIKSFEICIVFEPWQTNTKGPLNLELPRKVAENYK